MKKSEFQLLGPWQLSVADCTAVSTALQAHSETADLRKVSLKLCTGTNAVVEQLVSSLLACKSVRTFTMTTMFLSTSSSLQHMPGLSRVLANCARTLESVNLVYNPGIGHVELGKLSAGLKQCKSLKSLYLQRTGLTARGASILSDIVSSLPGLEKLDVTQNGLGDSGLEQLAIGLLSCTRLRQLALSDTEISTRSVPILCRLLASLPSLAAVWVDQNGFGDGDLLELRRAVHPNRRMHLSFAFFDLSPEDEWKSMLPP